MNPEEPETTNQEPTNKRAESMLESMRWVVNMMNNGNVNAKDVYPKGRYHGD